MSRSDPTRATPTGVVRSLYGRVRPGAGQTPVLLAGAVEAALVGGTVVADLAASVSAAVALFGLGALYASKACMDTSQRVGA